MISAVAECHYDCYHCELSAELLIIVVAINTKDHK